MLQITESAEQKIATLIEQNDQPIAGLRVAAQARSPFKVDYRLAFMAEDQVQEELTQQSFNSFEVYMDTDSVPLLDEATIDYVEGAMGSGFKIDSPNKVPEELRGTVAEKVLAVVEEQVNPMVASHGGHVVLMDVKDSVVFVELGGGCKGCGMARVTLKDGIEKMIKDAIPEIKEVLDVTDHAGGENPYYDKSSE